MEVKLEPGAKKLFGFWIPEGDGRKREQDGEFLPDRTARPLPNSDLGEAQNLRVLLTAEQWLDFSKRSAT